AVLQDGLVRAEIERDGQRARAVGSRQRERLPSAGGQRQGGVLQLRLGRRQDDGQLAEDLGVGVQRVARRAPVFVGERRPAQRSARFPRAALAAGSVISRAPRPCVEKLTNHWMKTSRRFWKPTRYQRGTKSQV